MKRAGKKAPALGGHPLRIADSCIPQTGGAVEETPPVRSEHLGHGARGPAFGVLVDVGVDTHRGLAVVTTCQLAVAPHPSADPMSHGDDGGVTAREAPQYHDAVSEA